MATPNICVTGGLYSAFLLELARYENFLELSSRDHMTLLMLIV